MASDVFMSTLLAEVTKQLALGASLNIRDKRLEYVDFKAQPNFNGKCSGEKGHSN